jgi:hypothetical protein
VEDRRRAVVWVKDDPFGLEFAEIALSPQSVTAEGMAIGTAPVPYRLDYTLETAPGFVTARLRASSRGQSWRRALDLRRDASGVWYIHAEQEGDVDLPPAGGDPTRLVDAFDCDLGLSPVTNLLPVLRHDRLSNSGSVELTAAWVAVPELSVQPDGQRYTLLQAGSEHSTIRYEAIDGSFAADITLDSDGIVIDYPGIAHRLPRAAA